MSDDLLSIDIDVDTDNYAETAAGDVPSLPRGHLSDEAFAATKAEYKARIGDGNLHLTLPSSLPTTPAAADGDGTKPVLSRKEIRLVAEAVGELYFEHRWAELRELLRWVLDGYRVDAKTGERWEGWVRRCEEKESSG